MKMMPTEMRQQMGEDMEMMENRVSTLQQHVELLEKEVKRERPEPEKVAAEADQILKQCEMMKTGHGNEDGECEVMLLRVAETWAANGTRGGSFRLCRRGRE